MKSVVMFMCLILLPAFSQQASENQTYHSAKLGLTVSLPKTWIIQPDEKNGYLSFYSPECFDHAKETPDLYTGLKMEIWAEQTDQDIAAAVTNNNLRKIKSSSQGYIQYEARYDRCYYLYTVIRGEKSNLLIIGYFPEKEKEALYLPLYQQIVASLKFK